MVEHRSPKPSAEGSSPSAPAKEDAVRMDGVFLGIERVAGPEALGECRARRPSAAGGGSSEGSAAQRSKSASGERARPSLGPSRTEWAVPAQGFSGTARGPVQVLLHRRSKLRSRRFRRQPCGFCRKLYIAPLLLLPKPDPLALGSGFVLSLVEVGVLTDYYRSKSPQNRLNSGLFFCFSAGPAPNPGADSALPAGRAGLRTGRGDRREQRRWAGPYRSAARRQDVCGGEWRGRCSGAP